MAIDKNSNSFTFIFAFIMVAVVGTILAAISTGLNPIQKENEENKKKMDILGAIEIESTRKNASEVYDQYIKQSYVINKDGEPVEGADAFSIDVKKQFRDKKLKEEDKQYPLYVAEKDGESFFIIPMVGKGLWGPIWGYIALKNDYATVFGAKFDHKSETPGLGAEIKYDKFQEQFKDKKIMAENSYKQLKVVKPGKESDPSYSVDGITGGTITSKGVEEMMDRTFQIYVQYFKTKKA